MTAGVPQLHLVEDSLPRSSVREGHARGGVAVVDVGDRGVAVRGVAAARAREGELERGPEGDPQRRELRQDLEFQICTANSNVACEFSI